MLYSPAIFQYQRRKTREVKVGDVGIGAKNPIRVQSMTISDTKDTDSVVRETIQLVDAGCEIVRITAPTIHHAENLKNIRDALRRQNIRVPLVADIHFTPQAAMIAADHVEKVRINPGNYADRKLFAVYEYSDQEYQNEIERMGEKFIPLVRKCKANGAAMRIGTNHGSLSDRIMNRYGDTPEGMVESAFEFLQIAEFENYYDIVFSMKASSPFIMIAAYRLLVQRLNETGRDYPIHLGVTEAGDGEDGRIKSALGIGALLEDGIGDTIRVSLTEDSIYEIPVAQALVQKFNDRLNSNSDLLDTTKQAEKIDISWNPIARVRRASEEAKFQNLSIGSSSAYAVLASCNASDPVAWTQLQEALKTTKLDDPFPDLIFLQGKDLAQLSGQRSLLQKMRPALKVGIHLDSFENFDSCRRDFDALSYIIRDNHGDESLEKMTRFFDLSPASILLRFESLKALEANLDSLQKLPRALLSLENSPNPIQDYRRLVGLLQKKNLNNPLHLALAAAPERESSLEAASVMGALLVDGIGDSLEIQNLPIVEAARLAFNILQASRLRISKAEFIACPSCGRTLFDLQTTTQRIRSKTGHLKGVKIAIMGCIVNGPGEMADADFGYVGGGPNKIHLYVGKDCVEKNVPQEIADERLIELIKQHERWVEPPAA